MVIRWYVPGMISLMGILPLLFWKTRPLQGQLDQRVLNVFLPKDGEFDGTFSTMFSEGMILNNVARKRQTSFYLNDFIEQRKDVLERIRHEAQEIKFGYDTSRVIKVVFGNNCTFNDLVSVINICMMDEHKRWVWVKDSIFIFAPDPPRIQEQLISCGFNNTVSYLEPAPRNWYKKLLNLIAENKLLIAGYIILVIASFFYQKKKIRNQKSEKVDAFNEQ
jgi:hypothetical protein